MLKVAGGETPEVLITFGLTDIFIVHIRKAGREKLLITSVPFMLDYISTRFTWERGESFEHEPSSGSGFAHIQFEDQNQTTWKMSCHYISCWFGGAVA